jgi:paraquat-inducible protein B
MTAQVNRPWRRSGLADAQRAGAAIDPLQLQIEGTATEMTATLEALRRTLEETHGLLSTDSGLGYGLQDALASLRDAADALSLLVNSLEQNPDMLLRGRKPPEE